MHRPEKATSGRRRPCQAKRDRGHAQSRPGERGDDACTSERRLEPGACVQQHEIARALSAAGFDRVEHERGQQPQQDNCADVPGVAHQADEPRGRASGVGEREVTDERRCRPCQHEPGAEGERRPRAGHTQLGQERPDPGEREQEGAAIPPPPVERLERDADSREAGY